MKIGLIHLSDIHFRKGSFDLDTDERIARDICNAIKTDLIGSTHVLLLISGDIAFAGDEEEYKYASDWFSTLYLRITENCNVPCWLLSAPGNHDVNHTEDREIRAALIQQIRQQPSYCLDKEIVGECVRELDSFFKFRADIEGNKILVYDDPLLRIHRIRDGDSIVQVNILNTAWMSSKDERPG